MTGVREATEGLPERTFERKKKKISAFVSIVAGEPAALTLRDGEKEVTVYADIPNIAETAPLTVESVSERLRKMGNTDYLLSAEDVEITLVEGLNLSPKVINQLRRDAVEALSDTRPAKVTTVYNEPRVKPQSARESTAQFLSADAYLEYKRTLGDRADSFDITFVPLLSPDGVLSLSNGVYLPPVVKDSEMEEVKRQLEKAKKLGVLYALVGNISQIRLSTKLGITPFGDFRLNVTNSSTRDALAELGLSHIILSPELTLPKARDIGGSVIVYGRVPLMLTERCFIKENFGCDKCGRASLTDRRGEKFPIIREYNHRNLILNSRLTYMGDKRDELRGAGLSAHHFIFSIESAREISGAVDAFRRGATLLGADVRRVGRRKHKKA